MAEDVNRPDWASSMVLRIRSHWWLKALGTTVAISAFMVVYFAVLNHPQFPVTPVPWTALDYMIPLQPWAIVPYASLWIYISLVPALMWLRREFAPYFSSVVLLSVIGMGIFVLWPTTVVQPDLDWQNYPWVAFLKVVAPSGNACPSMHVAFAVLTALWLQCLLRRVAAAAALHWVNVTWCALILWSTMALKQHLLLDVVSGTLLALVVVVPHLYFVSATTMHARRQLADPD